MDLGTFEDTPEPNCVESTPLSTWQLYAIIGAHYATFVVGTGALYVVYLKAEALKTRIFSPFLFMVALVWLQVGPAFEIASHDYEDNWELKNAVRASLVHGSFSFFNVGAVCLIPLSLHKLGVPLIRTPSFNDGCIAGLLDLASVLSDVVCAFTIVAMPALYYFLGRGGSQDFTIPINAISGITSLLRLWFNLGPNQATMYGGIGYLVLTLCGVFAFAQYKVHCIEFMHILIGGSFVLSLVPLSVAIWFVEPAADNEAGVDEETPLFKV